MENEDLDNCGAGARCNEDDGYDNNQRLLQLVNFGHNQWGFNNWSWSVTKQDLDFIDHSDGKYCVGVVAFVAINVKTFSIERENIGYATCSSCKKGVAIHRARKMAVTNALQETLMGFGGKVGAAVQSLVEGAADQDTYCANEGPRFRPRRPDERPANHSASRLAPRPSPVLCQPGYVPGTVECAPPLGPVPSVPVVAAPLAAPAPSPAAVVPAVKSVGVSAGGRSHRSGCSNDKVEEMTEEEVWTERRRRQKQAQERVRKGKRGERKLDRLLYARRRSVRRARIKPPLVTMRLLCRGYSTHLRNY